VTGAVPQATTSTSVVTAETEPERKPARSLRRKVAEPEAPVVETADTAQPVDRNLQRREERRRAKQQKPERSGVGRVVNTERMSGVKKFYYDTSSEIRKVVWPDRDTTRNLTIVVMVMSVIMGFLLGGIDFVLFRLFEAIT
jgi:preprotein translocase subunit SecE